MKTLTVTMMVKNLISLTFILGYVAGREPEVEIQDLFGDVLFQQGIYYKEFIFESLHKNW